MLAQQYSRPRISTARNQQSSLPESVPTRSPKLLPSYDRTQKAGPKSMSKSKSKPKSKPKVKEEPKTLDWFTGLARKKRRSSELFNKNFGFHSASLHAPSDHTPPISPRTSISHDQVRPPSRTEESAKRRRVDSQGAEMALGFPFGRPAPTTSMRGRDLGSTAMLPRGSLALARPSSSGPGSWGSGEAHPGTPVDWNAPRALPRLHDVCVAPEPRRRSFPSFSALVQRKRSKVSAVLARVQSLDAARKPEAISTRRKHSCTWERKQPYMWECKQSCPGERTQSCTSECEQSCPGEREEDTHATDTSRHYFPSIASLMEPAHERSVPSAPALQRATSDASTDAFLRHVRASWELRRSRDVREKGRVAVDYAVFADEDEKGFLDDAPL